MAATAGLTSGGGNTNGLEPKFTVANSPTLGFGWMDTAGCKPWVTRKSLNGASCMAPRNIKAHW